MNILDFYLLRPWWLLALLPALLFFILHLQQQHRHSRWTDAIDPELLDALLDNNSSTQHRRWPLGLLLTGWVLATLALSGPCFEKSNQNALKQADAVVILLDLSPSMLVKDVAPMRLQAAHYKILDLLRQRKEGYTGLVAYSGSAHVVAPLSDDTNTVAALVPTLEPGIMPDLGSQAEDAVQEALKLMENSHFTRGRLLLVSDGIEAEALASIHKQLGNKAVELHVIGVGTTQGGPIRTDSGEFVKDEAGNTRIFPFSAGLLQQLATENNGQYHNLSSDDSDIAALVTPPAWLSEMGNGNQRNANHTIENWHDAGYRLVLPCLLLALFAFRRGMIVCLLPLLFLTAAPDSRAMDLPDMHWQDWWQTPDQQAAAALEKGDTKTAAEKFRNPEWKAYSEYQNQQHAEAAKHFSASDSAAAHYNRGNALAHTLDFNGAIKEYDEALKRNPSLSDAEENKKLVKKLMEEKKNQQNQPDKNQENQQDKDSEQKDQQNQQQDQQQSGDKQEQQDSKQDQQQQDPQQQESQQGSPQDNSAKKSDEKKPDEQKSGEQQNDEKKAEEKQKAEERQAAEQAKESGDKKDQQANSVEDSKDPAEQEKQDAAKQWLRRVPDDPGGLLRNKFDYYYKLQQQQEMRARRNNPAAPEKETRW